jgi:endonuclease YncB( thermonuclease family)
MTLSSRRGFALATATFAGGLGLGALIGPELTARAVMAKPVPPAPVETSAMRSGHPAEVLRVLDGDTFEARVRVWPGIEITTKVRLRSIDAPELRARCPDERSKAEASRDALRVLLAEGDVMVTRVGLDKYGGRVLADAATRATPDIGSAMLAKGLARSYSGGKRESWCG